MIAKDRLLGWDVATALGQECAQELGGLRPQGAQSLLAPLAIESDLRKRLQLEVTYTQRHHFLHPGPRVEHGREQRIIASAIGRAPIHTPKDRFNFSVVEILDRTRAAPLEGDRQHTLTMLNEGRFGGRAVTEERVDRRQPDVPCRHEIVPRTLQILEEVQHGRGTKIRQI